MKGKKHLPVTTGNEIHGHSFEEIGVVRGIVVRSPNIFQGLFGVLNSIFGGNIATYEKICEQARKEAFDRMVNHAQNLGAEAVVAMRYDATEFIAGVTEVLAYGTAVRFTS
ncbi:MAG TPA: YbjQ family protein [Chroococcales cyanobacterium]